MNQLPRFYSADTKQEYPYYLCDNFIKRLKGYMFQKSPEQPSLLITNCNNIHMFFMNFPLDVIFLDENYRVIRRVDNLQPRQIVLPVRGAKMVMEAPVGSITGLLEGMYLEMKK